MSRDLFIIEAPGKTKVLSGLLWRAGVRNVDVMATAGNIGTNPDGFDPISIDCDYRETAYRLMPGKEGLAGKIRASASVASRIFIATDDDQEGDVIARDVIRFCLEPEDAARALRLRLKALATNEIREALQEASPFDHLSAARGDARRVVDRLIGSLSNEQGAVGRVQGSLLLALAEYSPVIGTMLYTMPSADGKGDWVARIPVYAGQDIPEAIELDQRAEARHSVVTTMSRAVMNYEQILLTASLRTQAAVGDISAIMQRLYEQGRMSYPRAKDTAISQESFRRLQAVAKINQVGFNATRFRGVRDVAGEHAHEAPNPVILDVQVNHSMNLLPVDAQVLVHVARALLDCGVPCQLQVPETTLLTSLPEGLVDAPWHRKLALGERLWEEPPTVAGFQPWTKEQSLLHFMSSNQLGRPSTLIDHIDKFLSRELVDDRFALTNKGKIWCANVGEIFGHKNISRIVESYLEEHRKEAPEMVSDIIRICELEGSGSIVNLQGQIRDEDIEVSTGFVC